MKARVLKTAQRYDLVNDRGYGIQSFADGNDYPQRVMEIVDASGTGLSCVGTYAKFIAGKGFIDKNFFSIIINSLGQTVDYLLNQIAFDYAIFGGFAIHINYNANFEIVELQHIPLESIRFEKLGEDNQFSRVAIHPDWGRRFLNLRKWRKEDIEFIDLFNPNPEEIQAQVNLSGGWKSYKGQVYYFSNQGEKVYPKPIFDPVLTDMNTEEGIANVSNRNARNNFLAAGMLIDKANKDQSDDQENDTEKALKQFQGDEKACKILYVQVEGEEDKPEFVSFKGTNYDKEFTVTLNTAQENIGKSFNQPPILRAVDVANGFAANKMKEAYDAYNSQITTERYNIERSFSQIFKHWNTKIEYNTEIEPLSYDIELTIADRLGDQLQEFMTMWINKDMLLSQKLAISKTIYGLTSEEVSTLNIS